MTDRKQALIALRDTVKGGDSPRPHEIFAAFPTVPDAERLVSWVMDPSDIRAMGAAKALHEAVLPGWSFQEMILRGKRCTVTLRKDALGDPYTGVSNNPARAWFLAILEALIAQEPGQ